MVNDTRNRRPLCGRALRRWAGCPALALAGAILLAGCACGPGVTRRVRMAVDVAERANTQSAVAVDLVFVYDDALVEALAAMPAAEWFRQRDQLRKDFPGTDRFVLWQWEWVPGQEVPLHRLPVQGCPKAGLVFANYYTPGVHRARFDPRKSIAVHLLETGFEVSPLP